MGRAGAGFAQSFTNTLVQGTQLMEQIRAREEDLDLKKKLISAQLEEHKAKTELATRALTAGRSLERLLLGEPSGDIELGMATGEPPRTPPSDKNRLAAMIAGIGTPETVAKAAELARAPEPLTPEAMRELVVSAGGGGQGAPSALPVTGTSAAPSVGREIPGLTQLPQVRFNISSKGELSVSVGTERLQNPMQITEIETANGFKQKVAVIRDLKTGATHSLPIGPAVPPQMMQEAARIVDAHGGDQLAPSDRELFIAQTTAALHNPDKDVTQELLAGLGEQITHTIARPGQAYSRVLDTRKAMEAVTARRMTTEIEKETRTEQAAIRTEQREPAVTEAKKTAEKRVELAPTYALLGRLETLLGQIGLPKKAMGRVTASGRLQLGYTSQDNQPLVLFESLKEGLVAAFARLVEKGTMTDQDIARARSLLPSVLPGVFPPTLPDTEATALGKLKQLRGLLNEITQRPSEATPTSPPNIKIKIPRGFNRALP